MRRSRKVNRVQQQSQAVSAEPKEDFAATVADLKQKIEDLREGMKTGASSQDELAKLRNDLQQRENQGEAPDACS